MQLCFAVDILLYLTCVVIVNIAYVLNTAPQTLGLQWNMLHGAVPESWTNLRAQTVWVRPGNYQLCGGKPTNASFELCKEIDGRCELSSPTCSLNMTRSTSFQVLLYTYHCILLASKCASLHKPPYIAFR